MRVTKFYTSTASPADCDVLVLLQELRDGCCKEHYDQAPDEYDIEAELDFQERKLLHGRAKQMEAEHAIRNEEESKLERNLAKWRRDDNEVLHDVCDDVEMVVELQNGCIEEQD